MYFSNGFFSTHKRTILGLVFGLAFSATLAYAVPPATKYTPAETLDPACIPGSSNCTVDISGTGAAWGLITGTLSDQTDLQDALDDKFDNPTGTTSQYIRGNGSLATFPALENPLTFSNGLTRTSDNVTNNLSTGVAGGQTVVGGTAAGDALRLRSTLDSTTGLIYFGSGNNVVYQESSNRFGFGTSAPQATLHIESPISFSTQPIRVSEGLTTYFQVNKVANNTLGLGVNAGISADNAINSTFIGRSAGTSALNAANSIFIGTAAGANDVVDNTVSGSSILIGDSTSTGGFSNSIAIGKSAINTTSNQFTIGPSYTQINARGVNYTWPSAQAGGSGYVLSNNGTGVLSWVAGGGGGSSIDLQTDGVSNGSQSILNLAAGSNVTLTDDGSGTVTIDASGGGGGSSITLQTNSAPNGSQSLLNLIQGTNITISDDGLGGITINNSATPVDSIYTADGTITGNRVVTYGGNLTFTDSGDQKTGLSFDQGTHISRLGVVGFPTFEVDSDNTRFAFLDGGLYIPGGASEGHVLTSDVSGNASWTIPQASGLSQASFFSAALGAGSGASTASQSIFLGVNAGLNDTVNNGGNINDYSILIGNYTSTGGFENSIAIGNSATNTASNQFVIGSTVRPIDSTVFYGTGGTSCTITTGTSMSCSSDERLKTNIEDLDTDTLSKLLSVRTVSYNWNTSPEGNEMVGFLAQDLEQYFPQLVSTGPNDFLQVNYAGITPILVEAIREMNLKITDIGDLTKDNSWRTALLNWFASATNGIGDFFSKKIHTDTLCVKKSDGTELCLDGDQLERALGSGTTVIITPGPEQTPDSTPEPTDQPAPQEGTEEAPVVDPVPDTAPETPAPEPIPAEPANPEISTPQ